MPISQVQLANTFNDFRLTVNQIANTVNDITGGTGPVSANTVSAGNLTQNRVLLAGSAGLISDDSNLTYDPSTDILTVAGTTDSSSATTGTLKVAGGVGIAKKLYVGSIATVSNTTDASSSTTGALVVAGGVGIAKKLYVGDDLRVVGTTTFQGNVVFLGSNTEVSTTQLNLNDPLLQLANNNTTDSVDIGIFGQYNQGSGNVHSGIFRDATDGVWKLFQNYSVEPISTIDITANGFAWANLAVGSLTTNTSATIGGSLGVTGDTTLSSTLAVTGNLNINTNKFNVTASSGNTAIAGTLGVTGATSLSTLSVSGATTLTGAANLSSTLAVSGATTLSSTLNVTGATTLSSTLDVTGTTTLTGTATLSSNTVLGTNSSNTITVNSGVLTLNNNLNINSGKFYFSQSNTRFGVNTASPVVSLDINTTDGIALPVGTTAQRPSGANVKTGVLRYNSTTSKPEIYNGSLSLWQDVGGGGGAGVGMAYFLAANL